MVIIFSLPKGCCTRFRWNFKRPLTWVMGKKLADKLGASPFKRDLGIETTFSQVSLAGQYSTCYAEFLHINIHSCTYGISFFGLLASLFVRRHLYEGWFSPSLDLSVSYLSLSTVYGGMRYLFFVPTEWSYLSLYCSPACARIPTLAGSVFWLVTDCWLALACSVAGWLWLICAG